MRCCKDGCLLAKYDKGTRGSSYSNFFSRNSDKLELYFVQTMTLKATFGAIIYNHVRCFEKLGLNLGDNHSEIHVVLIQYDISLL